LTHKGTDREHDGAIAEEIRQNDACRSAAWCRTVDTRARARLD
jgi:hypothetical protein